MLQASKRQKTLTKFSLCNTHSKFTVTYSEDSLTSYLTLATPHSLVSSYIIFLQDYMNNFMV